MDDRKIARRHFLLSHRLWPADRRRPGRNRIASVYGYDGQKTANGERANPRGMTAAHKSLPFGTMVTVVNKSNGRQVTVRINDRGPFIPGRIIDLTPAAASELGFSGLAPVQISVNGG